jgi:hypothetical protein
VTAPLEPPRYKVRIEIPRLTGTRGWSAAATAFEQGLAEHASLLVTQRQIELLTRQGRDYVRVSATVEASNVAEAAVVAWAVLQQAMAENADGWDTAGASAEIRPARSTRLPRASPGSRALTRTGSRRSHPRRRSNGCSGHERPARDPARAG